MRSPGSTSGKAGSSNFATSEDSPLKKRPKRWASRPRPSPGTGGSRGRGCGGSLADDDALFRLGVTLEFVHLLANQSSCIPSIAATVSNPPPATGENTRQRLLCGQKGVRTTPPKGRQAFSDDRCQSLVYTVPSYEMRSMPGLGRR